MSLLSHERQVGPNSFIDSRAFNSGILSLKYISTRHQVPLKKQMISPLLQSIISDMIDGKGVPNSARFGKLSPKEQHLLRSASKYFGLDGGSLPDPSGILDDHAKVTFGSLAAGNNSHELRKEAYGLLQQMYSLGKISYGTFVGLCKQYGLN
jgi:hypothetical protein